MTKLLYTYCILYKKRARAECDKIFEALDMAENLGVKIEAIL